MNILLAADGSKYTKRAVRFLAQHLKRYTRKPAIHVLHVHPPLPYPRAAHVVGPKAVERYQREESEAVLAVAEKELAKARLKAKASVWTVGLVAEEVAAYVKRHDIDYIVMGSHGYGAFESLVLGSTATKILAATKVPVLIVR